MPRQTIRLLSCLVLVLAGCGDSGSVAEVAPEPRPDEAAATAPDSKSGPLKKAKAHALTPESISKTLPD